MKRDIHENMVGKHLKTYSFISILGKGYWAKVYQAIDDQTGQQIAIKAVPKLKLIEQPKMNELIQTEIKVLKQCDNQNVVKYVDNFMSDATIFIAMEYCNGGDLDQYLQKKKRLTQDEATHFLKQILNGFTGLHKVKAMHRDFKLANVLLHQGVCKIADLGFAKQMQKKLTQTILGTSLTMAPQVLKRQFYGLEADLWSIGVVYYQMIYGKYPFTGNSDSIILRKIQKTRPDFSGVNISANAKDFIEKCLTVDPKQRIPWTNVYNHPLIKEEQKMAYGLTSRIKFVENQDVYKNQFQIDQILKNADKQWQIKNEFKPIFLQKSYKPETVNVQNMELIKKKNDEKKKIDLVIETYSKQYLNRRNNIMFIFKFVTPYIFNLSKNGANHGVTLFIVCKKAYQDIKTYFKMLQNKVNFLNLHSYFQEFVESSSYSQIVKMLKTDIEMIFMQIKTYKEDIDVKSCNQDVKNQFNVQEIFNPQWENFVKQIIQSYQFQLGVELIYTVVARQQKQDLIKVILALIFYKQNTENADIQVFDLKIQNLDYQKQQLIIKNQINSILNSE